MSPSKWGRDVKHKRGKKVGEMCDLERWIFNVASLWFDLHDNIFHEQSFGNSMPYLIRSIDLRIKLGWCINYCKNKGRSSTYCVLWIYKHFISFLVIFSMSDSTCVRITVLFTGKLLCIFYIFNHSGSTAVSVTPPLWSRNISTTNQWIVVKFCTDIYCFPGDAAQWFWWSPYLSSSDIVRFCVKYLNDYWMNCYKIWDRFPPDRLL